MGVQAPNRLAAAGAAAVLLAACGSISASDRHQPLAPAAASASDPTHSAGPGPRILAGMAYHEASQTVVLFGGQGATDYLNDTWTCRVARNIVLSRAWARMALAASCCSGAQESVQKPWATCSTTAGAGMDGAGAWRN